jgi:hypothetical protein
VSSRSQDPDQELGEVDSEEDISFPPAERRVVTQPVDLSVQTLSDQWDAGALVLPEIQREYVWDNAKASRLAESLLLNIPVPVLYFAETADAKYEIIDGHQRVKSIVRFLSNEFALSGLAVLPEYKGLRFHQLPDREQRFMKMRTLRVIIISIDSHPSMKFEIFERLNTGAISLNAQELRNSIYRGPTTELFHELASSPPFRELIGTKHVRRRMVDEELIVRFFALRDGLTSYRPSLKRFLNHYMETSKGFTVAQLALLTETFSKTVALLSLCLPGAAFRVADADGRALESSVNRALFDAQMLAFSWVSGRMTAVDPAAVRRELSPLYRDEGFRDAIQRATGDRARTLKRVRDTCSALRRAGLQVDTSHVLDS